MPRNEDGEFELVFGNRQLLSIFFIVVFLLGIFFVMGYIVGRNSTPGLTIASNKPAAGSATETSSAAASTPPDSSPSPIPSAAPPESKPAASQPPEVSRLAAKSSAESKPDSDTAGAAPRQPAAGEEFLQVVAVAHPDAEVITDTLQKRGFRARIAPGPSDKIFRVLVGPVKDAADMGKLRSELEAAGFKPIVRKY